MTLVPGIIICILVWTAAPPPAVPPIPNETRLSGPEAPPTAKPLAGIASWYGASGMIAAAGPVLRRALGPSWRGQRVRVCVSGRCIRVVLADWCQCYKGTRRERLLDLSDDAFRRLAALSRGLVRVQVEALG